MALHLHDAQYGVLIHSCQSVRFQELLNVFVAPFEYDMNVFISCFPGIDEYPPSFLFENHADLFPKPIQRIPDRFPPFLIPPRMTTGITAAIGPPSLYAMYTTPRTVLNDLSFIGDRKKRKILCIIGQPGLFVLFDPIKTEGECHVAMLVMMAIRFPIGSDVN